MLSDLIVFIELIFFYLEFYAGVIIFFLDKVNEKFFNF